MSLDSLYQQVILDHCKNPRNFGTLENPQATAFYDNPSCGDEIQLQILINEKNHIEEIKFSGHGCAISQASASMMTEAIKGKSVAEVENLLTNFQSFMTDEDELKVELEDLEALQGVKKFPVRVKCATLAWTALEDILKKSCKT